LGKTRGYFILIIEANGMNGFSNLFW